MSKNTTDKKNPVLETSFEDILVCKKNSLRPHMEIFVQKPENVNQQNLGILAGIFEIIDDSEDSSYIVNYLVSVIKKEYYSKVKRGPIESFEAALHKTNLALTKLAEHGNIGWIGKINAVISIIEKNNIHIAQTGSAKALLIRSNVLTDISENSPELENPNPLKTFVEVTSGRLEKNDKLIITTRDIFDIFSLEEIKKSALKFSPAEFVQFLKTALVNELEKASVLIIEAWEKEIIKNNIPVLKKDSEINAFSQKSFSKSAKKNPHAENKELATYEEKQIIINEIKEELKKESTEFINKKTGHIYIKEDTFLQRKKSVFNNLLEESRDKISTIGQDVSLSWKKNFSRFLRKKTSSQVNLSEINKTPEIKIEKISPWKIESFLKFKKNILLFISLVLNKTKLIFSRLVLFFIKQKDLLSNLRKKRPSTFLEDPYPQTKKDTFFQKTESSPDFFEKKYSPPSHYFNDFMRQLQSISQLFIKKIKAFFILFGRFMPKFSQIKSIFSAGKLSQKIYAFLILLLLFVVPYFIVKFQDRTKENKAISKNEAAPEVAKPLENDKGIVRIENINSFNIAKKEITEIINLNNQFFALSAQEIIDLENNQIYPIPSDFSSIKISSGMDDLNLIFILNEKNKLLSWSPISKKFQDNLIIIPENSEATLMKTYLTYLYILDKKNNQIYRYPRATGGFGEKISWLKDSLNLNEATDMAVSENIFLVLKNNVTNLLKGKKQEFKLGETATPIKADSVFAKIDSQNIYILDKTNSRIVKLDLSGNIISQFYNSEISSALAFSVNEENKLVYFSSKNGVKSFEMK